MKNQIELTQSPVIKHDLVAVGLNVTARIEALNVENLVATNDTIKAMKSLRAELNKEAKEFEAQRKIVKDAVNNPYKEFEAVYKSEVIDKYKGAVDILKDKIGSFEMRIKEEKQANIERYFTELCLSENIDFVKFSQLNIKIDLSTSEKKYKDFCNEYILKVQEDVKLIESETYQAEIMAEYKTTLNASKAITEVRSRKLKEKEEQERIILKRTQRRENMLRNWGMSYFDMTKTFVLAQDESVSVKQSVIENDSDEDFQSMSIVLDLRIKEIKAKAARELKAKLEAEKAKEQSETPTKKDVVEEQAQIPAPEVKQPLQAPKEVIKEETFNAVFEVEGTMSQLKALGEYMKAQGIEYKNI